MMSATWETNTRSITVQGLPGSANKEEGKATKMNSSYYICKYGHYQHQTSCCQLWLFQMFSLRGIRSAHGYREMGAENAGVMPSEVTVGSAFPVLVLDHQHKFPRTITETFK